MSAIGGNCLCGGMKVVLPAPVDGVGACHCDRCRPGAAGHGWRYTYLAPWSAAIR
jgi:hypothetical protein